MKRQVRRFLKGSLLLLLLAPFIVVMVTILCSDVKGRNGDPYSATVKHIESSVQAYLKAHAGEAPIVNSTVISVNGSNVNTEENYYVIAACLLVGSNSSSGFSENALTLVHPRNCWPEGANAEPANCLNLCEGHYLWLTTRTGDVASICIGAECEAHGEDGYQGVYP